MTNAMIEYGRADLIQGLLGLSAPIGQKVAAIITFSGSIEYYLELALWKLRGLDPKGMTPDTDSRMVSGLITMLEAFASNLPCGNERALLEDWSKSARCGFTIRHNIAHGVAMALPNVTTPVYVRNPRWHGEVRKRQFGDFWADEPTLDLVRQAMAVLLRIIILLASEGSHLNDVANPLAIQALQTAHSVLSEFASQDYNPSYEKY